MLQLISFAMQCYREGLLLSKGTAAFTLSCLLQPRWLTCLHKNVSLLYLHITTMIDHALQQLLLDGAAQSIELRRH